MNEVESQIAGFIAAYTPAMGTSIRAARKRMQALFPTGYEMVYDNYNALVFGYSPTPRPSAAILSIAAFPQWVTLCFLQGAKLADPHVLLKGSGTQVRHRRLASVDDFDDPRIAELIDAARATVHSALDAAPPLSTVIRSISARQRPRRATV